MRSTIESPRPEAARDLGAVLQADGIRGKSRAFAIAGMPSPVSCTSMRSIAAAPAAADQHASLRRVFDRVRDQVLQQPPQQPAVRCAPSARQGTKISSRPFSRASGANSTSSWRITSSIRNEPISGFIAPVSSREISSSAPKISSTASSEASILPTSLRVLAAALALDQRGDVKPRGIERLQDVVARGGEKARLRDIGFLRVGLGAHELGVQPRQLGRALAHALAPAPPPPLRRSGSCR